MNFTEKKCRNWKRDQENTSLMSTQMRLMLIQGFVYLERRNPGYYETRGSFHIQWVHIQLCKTCGLQVMHLNHMLGTRLPRAQRQQWNTGYTQQAGIHMHS
ncbi:uncharacterized protein LOC113358224 [Papaver somniferum]|uniref:uncharacterized protein LOC113358224 n=1 Tax=Papaver somniferum TaxID=3469 RepID=UPI000E6F7C8D|nr:uncharacterized protein LOC113358224 [Papaver somniferum]